MDSLLLYAHDFTGSLGLLLEFTPNVCIFLYSSTVGTFQLHTYCSILVV